MRFSKQTIILRKENRVVLVNKCTRNWYRLSEELFSVIKFAVDKNLADDELLQNLYDEEDRKIVKDIINHLKRLKIILETEEDVREELNITMAITDRCNLLCKHCSYNAKYSENIAEKVSKNEMMARMKSILCYNPTSIILTGGEPMIRDDFIELIDWLKNQYKGKIFLMTNGTLINNANVKKIVNTFSQIDISIDGIDDETCEKIRGKGVYDKVVKAVQLLQHNNFHKISLSMVDTHITHKYIREFYKLNEKLNTHPIIRSFSAVGRGEKNKHQLELKGEDYEESKQILSENVKTNFKRNFKSSGCGAGRGNFFVDYDGKIYGCATLREFGCKLGEINNIKEVINYEENASYKEMTRKIPEKCKKCDVNIFCIECLADFFEIEEEFETFCSERKKCIQDIVWGIEEEKKCL